MTWVLAVFLFYRKGVMEMDPVNKAAHVEKQAGAGEPDMARINQQALRELKAEEVFTFRIAAADTLVDRDFEHFSRECLEGLAKLYVGKPVLTDHSWSAGQAAGPGIRRGGGGNRGRTPADPELLYAPDGADRRHH